MTDKPIWVKDFIDRLLQLADPQRPQRDTLAELRRCRGDDTGRALYRVGWLFADPRLNEGYALDDAVLVACLFATHWKESHQSGINLGQAVRKLHEATGSDSIAKRFIALLDCKRDDLDDRLRPVISLLNSREIPLDWAQLLVDLHSWDHPQRRVQRQWARAFWREGPSEDPEQADHPVTTSTASV